MMKVANYLEVVIDHIGVHLNNRLINTNRCYN